MSRYKKYKDSGHVGIGEVPEHWHLKRMKHLGDAIIGLTYSPNDVIENEEGILVLRSSNIQEGFISFDDCVYVTKEVNPTLLTRKGDILICARNGSAHLVGKNICIDEKSAGLTFGAFMVVFRGKYWRYLSYFFNSPIFTSQTGMFSTTTINQLTSQTLNNLRIAYPTDEAEQNVICDYLDIQTQRIDQLITNKKAQAEKLKELRQIEMNNAVTKGLNPDAEMKDSGIDWLGKIPKHWEVKRLKNLAKQIGEKSIEILEDDFLIALENIEGFTGSFIDTASEYENNGIKFQKNNLLYNKLRPYLNKVYLADRDGICVGDIIVIECLKQIHPAFLQFRMLSEAFCSLIMSSVYGSKMPRTSWQFISSLKIGYPLIEEQIEIVEYLQKRTSSIENLIKNLEGQIEKLQELRKIKIYEAVTGKIKVNSYAETTA
jgi:type I restriction enzyme S subunit